MQRALLQVSEHNYKVTHKTNNEDKYTYETIVRCIDRFKNEFYDRTKTFYDDVVILHV